jgi:hypothetical protein
MGTGVGEQRLVALFAAGCLLLNFPLLVLWDRDVTLMGVPLLPAALFLIWAVLIAALASIVERCEDPSSPQARSSLPEATPDAPSAD